VAGIIVSLALFLGVVGFASPSWAIHRKGVGRCNACHITHDTTDGVRVSMVGGEAQLRAQSPSDLCLDCHAESVGAVFAYGPLIPAPEKGGGNFIFLLEDNLNDGPEGAVNPISGDAAGHNLNALGRGLTADMRFPRSPGGSFASSDLGCTSCHDPHGNSNFRMLYGAGEVQGNLFSFSYPAPIAYGIPLGETESESQHTAYIRGVSDWCGNCHGRRYEHEATPDFGHTGDEPLGGVIAQRYRSYNGSLDPSGGLGATSYLAEVPFEDSSNSPDSTSGPSAGSRVMCLSCHRAHASSAPASGRWDFNVTALGEDGKISGSYSLPNPFVDPAQESLCFKCHAPEALSGAAFNRRVP